MSWTITDEQAVGIDLEPGKIRAAYVENRKGQPYINQLIELDLTQAEKGAGIEDLSSEGRQLKDLLKQHLAISAIPTQDVLVRRLRIKLLKEKDIDEAFPFQAESLLPFSLEEGVIDKIKLEKQETGTLLTLIAVRKDFLDQHLKELAKWDVDPEIVSTVPVALSAFAHFAVKNEDSLFVLHLGLDSSTCAFVKQGKLFSAHSCPMGVQVLFSAFFEDNQHLQEEERQNFHELDFLNLDIAKWPHLKEAFERWRQEMGWLLLSQVKEAKIKETPRLLFTGEGAGLPAIISALDLPQEYVQVEVENGLNSEISVNELKVFAVAIGLALTALPGYGDRINFRQGEFSYPNPWRRFKQPLIIFFALCIALSVACYWLAESYLKYKEDKLKEKYVHMLPILRKSYKEIEAKVEPSQGDEEKNVRPAVSLTLQDLTMRLNYLEKEIKAIPDTYPLYPNVPRVSDVLAWLSTHPKVVCKDEKEECDSLELESLHYTMVKYPEQSKKNEKYQVKVDLEFSTPSPTIAREFHDALIAPNDLVDPKGEVKWTANRGKYRSSFYLKDKTFYPTALKE